MGQCPGPGLGLINSVYRDHKPSINNKTVLPSCSNQIVWAGVRFDFFEEQTCFPRQHGQMFYTVEEMNYPDDDVVCRCPGCVNIEIKFNTWIPMVPKTIIFGAFLTQSEVL